MSNVNMTRRSLLAAGTLLGGALLAGCGQAAQGQGASEPTEQEAATDESADEPAKAEEPADQAKEGATSKVIVVYYSRADENYADGGKEWLEVGHTKVMAGYIAEALGADEYEIEPKKAYPEGYDECCDVALEEQKNDTRPEIVNPLPNLASYDTVFIGCPIWWGDEPMIVRTFIEGVDLSGKTVVPFTTHGGSGLGSVPANLRAALPDAHFLDGYAVAGTSVDGAHDEVTDWAKSLALA